MQPADRWQPSDFIVHGRYCSPHQIVDELEDLRRRWSAKALVLIVFRENTFFRPLLRLAHEDRGRLEEIQETLTREMTFEVKQSKDADLTSQLLSSLPIEDLNVGDLQPMLLSHLEQSHPMDPDTHQHPGSRPASFHVVVFGGEPPEAEALARLQLMINSSAPVVAHRELEAQMDLRKLLTKTELSWQEERRMEELRQSPSSPSSGSSSHALVRHGEDGTGYARMLLDLALEVTRSSVGNIYLVSRDGQALELVAQRGNDNAIEELLPMRISAGDEEPVFPGVVGRVFGRGRALIINDVDDYERANAHAQFLSVVREPGIHPYAELAVPIEQGPFASSVPPFSELPKSSPIGVLNVERVRPKDSEAGDYLPTDLSALQTIALLYALRRAGSLTAFSADSLAWLTEATALHPPHASLSGPPGDRLEDVPLDMRSARPTLAYIAKRIYELTRSSSVTIRVVTPDQLSLARFVAEPEERMHDDHATIPIAAIDSVNAWVARMGRPCYIPNMRNHPTRPFPGLVDVIEVEQRKQIRSELCLPIKAHGRLVGTLNLESQHRSDYPDDVSAVVRALAQQVGLAISQSRRNDERRLFSFQAQQASQAHRVLREVDKLELLVKQDEAGLGRTQFGADLSRVLRAIRRASDPEITKTFEVELLTDGWVAAGGVVRILLEKTRYKGHLDVRTMPPASMRLPKLVGQVLTLCLDELLRNALGVVTQSRDLPSVLVVRFEEAERAGRPYLRAEVVNAVARPLKPEIEERLYRGPIRFGRTHIGAYVVGAFVRSVGGEVYIKENSASHFGVRLEVPTFPAEDSGDELIGRVP